jgi:hypothetical protein
MVAPQLIVVAVVYLHMIYTQGRVVLLLNLRPILRRRVCWTITLKLGGMGGA